MDGVQADMLYRTMYDCDLCQREFGSEKNLSKHYMRVHDLCLEEADRRAEQQARSEMPDEDTSEVNISKGAFSVKLSRS